MILLFPSIYSFHYWCIDITRNLVSFACEKSYPIHMRFVSCSLAKLHACVCVQSHVLSERRWASECLRFSFVFPLVSWLSRLLFLIANIRGPIPILLPILSFSISISFLWLRRPQSQIFPAHTSTFRLTCFCQHTEHIRQCYTRLTRVYAKIMCTFTTPLTTTIEIQTKLTL